MPLYDYIDYISLIILKTILLNCFMFKKETLQMPYIHHSARNKLCRFVGGGGVQKVQFIVSERHHTVILNFKSVFFLFCQIQGKFKSNQRLRCWRASFIKMVNNIKCRRNPRWQYFPYSGSCQKLGPDYFVNKKRVDLIVYNLPRWWENKLNWQNSKI